MKTLREYIDQLDEISRRDFLKGAGALGVVATAGVMWSDVKDGRERFLRIKKGQSMRDVVDIMGKDSALGPKVEKPDCQTQGEEYFKNIGSWPYLSNGKKASDVVAQRCARTPTAFTDLGKTVIWDYNGVGKITFVNGRVDKIEPRNQNSDVREESEPEDPIQKIDRLFRDK
jgi:hypothetical protein